MLEVRRPGGDPSAAQRVDWILVDRQEELDIEQGEVQRARLCIYYWDLDGSTINGDVPSGEFSASYDKIHNLVSLTASCLSTGGYVRIDPPSLRGAHLGTYLMNQVVLWAKQWPDAQLREISLAPGDGSDRENRARRNRFYEQFGIVFDYRDTDHKVGESRPMIARELRSVTSWANSIIEHSIVDFLRESVAASKTAGAELRMLKRDAKDLRHRLTFACRRPIRWMLARLLLDNPARSLFYVCLAAVIVVGFLRAR